MINFDEMQNSIEEYLNKKYSDKFAFYRRLGGTFASDKLECEFTSSLYPYVKVWGAMYYEGRFVDNYPYIKYAKQLNASTDSILSKYIESNLYFFEKDMNYPKSWVPDFNDMTSYGEFASMNNTLIHMNAYVDSEVLEREDVIDRLENIIADSKVKYRYISIYYIDNYITEDLSEYNYRNQLIYNRKYRRQLKGKWSDDNSGYIWEWTGVDVNG